MTNQQPHQNNKNYILANFQRSYDNYHVSKNLIHLVGSLFFTDDAPERLEYLYSSPYKWNRPHYILNFLDYYQEDELRYTISVKEIKPNLTEIVMHPFYFLNYFNNEVLKSGDSPKTYIRLFETIIGDYSLVKKDLPLNLSNVLFVFQNISWFDLKATFEIASIKLSGGSVTKRGTLTPASFNLSKFLSLMSYTNSDVYKSFKLSEGLLNSRSSLSTSAGNKSSLETEQKSKVITQKLLRANIESLISKTSLNISELLKTIERKKSELIQLEKDRSNLISKKQASGKLLINSKRLQKLNTREVDLHKFIKSKELNITELETKIDSYKKELSNLNSLDLKSLRSKYLNEFYSTDLFENIQKVRPHLRK